jgi:predicted cytidylate kinase
MTVITISGLPGSGKTTVAKLLEDKMGIPYVYSGDIFRKMADKYKMSLEEFGRYCENNKSIDEELDKNQLKLLKKGTVILEGRIAGWIASRNKISSTKIFIEADFDTRIHRIINREEGEYNIRKQEISDREKSEATRYKKFYGIDIFDKSIYDLIIDSSNKTPEEIVEIILKEME